MLSFWWTFWRLRHYTISGVSKKASVLDLANKTEELQQHIFQPFETAVLSHGTYLHPSLLTLYTNLLHHWTVLLRTTTPIPPHANTSISLLITHVNTLTLALIQSSPTLVTTSAILTFYETFVQLVTTDILKPYISIELPPAPLIYALFFSGHVTDMSRLCDTLACYKKGFNDAVASRQSGEQPSYRRTREQVAAYNAVLMDICNALWRKRAFSDAEANEHGCLVPSPTLDALSRYLQAVDRTYELTSILNFSYSPTLSYLSLQRIRELEDQELQQGKSIRVRHAGPVTEQSLLKTATAGGLNIPWLSYRINVLDSLTEKGLSGVAELLKCTMTRLKKDMETR